MRFFSRRESNDTGSVDEVEGDPFSVRMDRRMKSIRKQMDAGSETSEGETESDARNVSFLPKAAKANDPAFA